MHLLPRSRRGTWLLAGAVWCAACAGLWWTLPAVTWAEWKLPEYGPVIGLCPGDGALVSVAHTESLAVKRDTMFCIHDPSLQGPICISDAWSGRLIRSFLAGSDRFDSCQLSTTGRYVALADNRLAEQASLRLLDLTLGTITSIPLEKRAVYSMRFGLDDRWLDYVTSDGIWGRLSVPDLRPAGQTQDVSYFAVYSSDGRTMAVGSPENDPPRISILDTESKGTMTRVGVETGFNDVDTFLSNDKAVFAARMAKSTHSPEMPADWVCRRTSNGRELLRVHNPAQASLSPDGRIAVTLNSGNMTIWNVAVAKPLFDHLIGGDAVGPPMISPDSRHVAIGSKTYPRDVIGDWLRRIGLSSPFPREAGYRSVSIFDGLTGRPRGLVRGDFKSAVWSADSSQLAVTDQDGSTVRVWTVQPRKSLAWFAVGAALLALPIAFTAWRRGRKLIA